MQRIPEPELMDELSQARAYARADFSEPNALFVDHLLPQLAGMVPGRLIDLGCGPGDICIRLARALPGWQITGLDAGPNMLALAAADIEQVRLGSRIDLVEARLPDHGLAGNFQAVVSNSLLHHLPDPMSLWRSINELATDGTVVQVMDLARPDNESDARQLVESLAADEPEVLQQDFYNSLLAAWTPDEVTAQLEQAGLGGLALTRPTDRHWLVQGRISRK